MTIDPMGERGIVILMLGCRQVNPFALLSLSYPLLTATVLAGERLASESADSPTLQVGAQPENSDQVSAVPPLPCEDASKSLAWAEVIEMAPDANAVTDSVLRDAIVKTGLPWRVRDRGTGIELVLIPPGQFVMGKSPFDNDAEKKELPSHEVILTEPFYLGRYEVTQAQFLKVMGHNPSEFPRLPKLEALMARGMTQREAEQETEKVVAQSRKFPVESVTWADCLAFCKKTNLRVPTEAEWEFACRAGQRVPRYGHLEEIAWGIHPLKPGAPVKLPPQGPTEVGTKKPNPFGLYDMLGNVLEWVNDWFGAYSPDIQTNPTGPSVPGSRVLRGGGWRSFPKDLRASHRVEVPELVLRQETIGSAVGFRVAKTP